jgi:PHD/YefM family antitoxin component YafN of YafNO toxin-antitoxin module
MARKRKRKAPEIVLREGKPTAVILDIEEYQEMLERLEDTEDLKMLEDMRKKPLKFRRLDDFQEEFLTV